MPTPTESTQADTCKSAPKHDQPNRDTHWDQSEWWSPYTKEKDTPDPGSMHDTTHHARSRCEEHGLDNISQGRNTCGFQYHGLSNYTHR